MSRQPKYARSMFCRACKKRLWHLTIKRSWGMHLQTIRALILALQGWNLINSTSLHWEKMRRLRVGARISTINSCTGTLFYVAGKSALKLCLLTWNLSQPARDWKKKKSHQNAGLVVQLKAASCRAESAGWGSGDLKVPSQMAAKPLCALGHLININQLRFPNL